MNFRQMQDEVIAFRFHESQRAYVIRWINQVYQQVWVAADWHFKYIYSNNLNVVAGSSTPVLPGDFGNVISVFDDQGFQLTYLTPQEFSSLWRGNTGTGKADTYTVVGGTLHLGITPSTSLTYTMDYMRRVSHLDDGVTAAAGFMDSDNDTPLWDSEHHYMLVPGAMALGMKESNDFTFGPLEEEYKMGLAAMVDEMIPPDTPENRQYGRDLAW